MLKVSDRALLAVLVRRSSAKSGMRAREAERRPGVAREKAWFMLRRVRVAMKREPWAAMLAGTVVADETFFGGKPKNRHQQGKQRSVRATDKGSGGFAHKTPVLSLVNKATGEVRSRVVPEVTGATLRKAIAEQVDMAATHLHTDASGPYKSIGAEFAAHSYVDHSRSEYVRGNVSTNAAENYFSQLKRSVDGTHHHVSRSTCSGTWQSSTTGSQPAS